MYAILKYNSYLNIILFINGDSYEPEHQWLVENEPFFIYDLNKLTNSMRIKGSDYPDFNTACFSFFATKKQAINAIRLRVLE
jgi:hypothetical protein